MMTEKQAWLKLAKMWGKAVPNPQGGPFYCVVELSYSVGLCGSISVFYYKGLINDDTYDRMEHKIRERKSKMPSWKSYIWPLNKQGANYRVKFCKKMALECAKCR